MEYFQEKKKIERIRFTDININFDVKYEGEENYPKIISINILRVFSNHHM